MLADCEAINWDSGAPSCDSEWLISGVKTEGPTECERGCGHNGMPIGTLAHGLATKTHITYLTQVQ